jgi:hypothetical protein
MFCTTENLCVRGPLITRTQLETVFYPSAHHVAHRHLNPVSAGAGASGGRPFSKEGHHWSSKEGYRRRDAAVGASAKTAADRAKWGGGVED